MVFVWKVTLAIGLCCSLVLTEQPCPCMDRNTCSEKDGNPKVSQNNSISTQQCQGDEVLCCSLSENIRSVQRPKVAPGPGCGRKRFSDDKRPPRIASYGESPWSVAILNKDLFLRCSGSLIKPNIVLTAGHCLSDKVKASELFVRAGDYEIGVNKPYPSQLKSIQELIRHPDFNVTHIKNDIAIIVLKEPVELTPVVDIICTPEEGKEVIESECFVSGYGFNIIGNKTYRRILKKMNYSIKSQEYCLEEYKTANASSSYHLEENICGVGDEEKDACQGDGGGPLYCPLKADPDQMVQMGITSWGVGCDGKFPLAFTSVKHYLPWVKEKLEEISLDIHSN